MQTSRLRYHQQLFIEHVKSLTTIRYALDHFVRSRPQNVMSIKDRNIP